VLPLLSIAAALANDIGTVGIGARLSGELLTDRSLALAYGSSSLSGEIYALLPLPYHLQLGAAVGYRRMGGTLVDAQGQPTQTATWLWYAPVQVTVGGWLPVGSIRLHADVGPSVIPWEEQQPPELALGVGSAGAKLGFVVEGGASVPIALQRSLHSPDAGPAGLDVSIGVGYRHSFLRRSGCVGESPCGLSFSALKASVGLTLRL